MDDRSFMRSGALAAIVGGVLALVGNLLHPRYMNIEAPDQYRKIAQSGAYVIADVIIIAAIILVIAGFVAMAEYLGARYARVAAVIGGAIALTQGAVETYGVRQAARLFAFADRPNQVGSFWATSSIDHVNTGLFGMWSVVFLGLAPLFLGLAIVRTKRLPTWLGALGIVGGAITAVVGVLNMLLQDADPLNIPFLVGSLLVTVFVIAAGFALWQRTNTAPAVSG